MEREVTQIISKVLLIGFLALVSATDIKKRKIPDIFETIIICFSVFINDLSPLSRLLGVAASLPLLLYACKTNRLGGGDVKLVAAFGWCLGWFYALAAFLVADLIFAISTHSNTKYPFAPYLCGVFSFALILTSII